MRLLSLLPAALLPLVAAQLVSPELVAEIDTLRKTWGVPGLGISVVRGDAEQFVALGNASASAPVGEDTLFPLASCSKVLVAYALEQLMSAGVQVGGRPLGWDTRMAAILGDDWKLPDKYASEHATLLDVAAMRTGQPGHDAILRDVSPREAVRGMRDLPMTSSFRAGWQYSSLGYAALARAVEVLARQSYPEYARAMLASWGAADAHFNLSAAAATGRLAAGHYSVRSDSACAASAWPSPEPACLGAQHALPNWLPGRDALGTAGFSGLVASLPAVRAMQRAMLAQTLDWPVQPTGGRDPFASDTIYGLGQNSYVYKGARLVGHSGALPGHSAQIWHCPEARAGVAVLGNDSEFPNVFLAAVYTLLEGLLDLPRTDWSRMVFDRIVAGSGEPSPAGSGTPVLGAFCHKGYGRLVFEMAADRVVQALPPGVSKVNATRAPMPDDAVSTHAIVLTPVQGAFYNWTAVMDRYDPPLVSPRVAKGTAVVTPRGIGMFDRFSTAGNVPLFPASLEDVERRAEVWFHKC